MTQEYSIPPPEGPIPKEQSIFRVFRPDDTPVEIGSLEKTALSYVGDWQVFMDKQGYGIVYRLGTKEGLKDDEGDPVTLFIYFANIVARRGLTMTPEIQNQLSKKLELVIQRSTIQAHQTYGGNILSARLDPPEWMMKELEDLLK